MPVYKIHEKASFFQRLSISRLMANFGSKMIRLKIA